MVLLAVMLGVITAFTIVDIIVVTKRLEALEMEIDYILAEIEEKTDGGKA